jgi:hypothetical protein
LSPISARPMSVNEATEMEIRSVGIMTSYAGVHLVLQRQSTGTRITSTTRATPSGLR